MKRQGSCRLLAIAALCTVLAGCETFGVARTGDGAELTTATVAQPAYPQPGDDLGLGKWHFRAGNFGLAEQHFRRVVEANASHGEGWLGLAAAYDQLRRFELADRAYTQAVKIVGAQPAVLNNRGYSYLLRGDLRRARQDLNAASRQDPDNPLIRRNLELLGKAGSRA